MSDECPPPSACDGDIPAGAKPTVANVSDAVTSAVHTIGGAIERGKRPGMPLSILSHIAREAPLASLLVAFLLGVAVARRR